MRYLKVWTNFREVINTLEYDEIGRLFEMMLIYAETGEEPTSFDGNERFLWPVAKQQIDMAYERNEKMRENGSKGGRPKTKENQNEPNKTNDNQTKAYKEKKRKEIEIKDICKEIQIPSVSDKEMMSADDAQEIQSEQNRVLDAAEDAGFKMSNSVRAQFIALYAEFGLQKMLDSINECVTHSAVSLAYLRAVLNSNGKRASPKNSFPQRDYKMTDEKLLSDLAKEMDAFMKEGTDG